MSKEIHRIVCPKCIMNMAEIFDYQAGYLVGLRCPLCGIISLTWDEYEDLKNHCWFVRCDYWIYSEMRCSIYPNRTEPCKRFKPRREI